MADPSSTDSPTMTTAWPRLAGPFHDPYIRSWTHKPSSPARKRPDDFLSCAQNCTVKCHSNTLGIRRIMFAVEDIEDVLARLHAHGAELIGDLDQYEDRYRLCYLRGPAGIIIALAEQLR